MSFRRRKSNFEQNASLSQSQSIGTKRIRATGTTGSQLPSSQYSVTSSSQYLDADVDDGGDDEELVNDIVCFLLTHNSTLRPLKRTEILQCGMASSAPASSGGGSSGINVPIPKGKRANDIIKSVGHKLEQVFGIKLVEAESQKYILVNTLKPETVTSPVSHDDPEIGSTRVLLLLMLSAMFHNPAMSVSEDTLIGFLQKLSISVKSCDAYFGDVSKKIQEFEKQMYIKKTTVAEELPIAAGSSDPGTTTKKVYYAWGQRSLLEIGKEAVFNFLCKVYDRDAKNMPENFQQYLEANSNGSTS